MKDQRLAFPIVGSVVFSTPCGWRRQNYLQEGALEAYFRGSEERSHKSAVFRLRLAIGVPRELFEGLPVSDNNVAPVRANETVAFKDVERRCDAWTANREHQRNELVRQRNLVA